MKNNNKGLAISHFGMLSSLGNGAEANASAMQCGYDGFEASQFLGDRSEPYLTAEYPFAGGAKGMEKQAQLIAQALLETFAGKDVAYCNGLPIIFCFPDREDIWDAKKHAHLTLGRVKTLLEPHGIIPNKNNQLVLNNRCAVAEAFSKAQALFEQRVASEVVIVTSDSLVTRSAIDFYSGDMYEEGIRLLTDDNPNGFIAGEATVSFIVSPDTPDEPHLRCLGWGEGREEATWGSGKVLRAKGLIEAVRKSLKMAEVPMTAMDFMLGSASGEDYFFKEIALAQTQCLEEKTHHQTLWLPASHIGETGTAAGGAILVMANYAMQKGYAPGRLAVAMLSDDDERRAGLVLHWVSD